MKKLKDQSYYTNRHSCFMLCYHMVLVTKFRHPVLVEAVKDRVYEIIRDTMESRGYNIVEMNGDPDYVHVLFEAMPSMAPQELMNALKTRTSRHVRKEFADEIGKYYWKPYFWSDSYFIATVGDNTRAMVSEYIKNQR